MKRLNTSPISGAQELLPSAQAVFDNLKAGIAEVFRLHGFQNVETPIIDRNEILFAKAGGDTEKQIYRVVKTTESAEDSKESLRFDHTVPLARYIVEHESNLAFPFRASQIGLNFRGERAQRGRFREFYQCDIDVVGRETLPISYDAQVIATLSEALKRFNLPAIKIRVNNRKLLNEIIKKLGLSEKSEDIYSIIDHAEKVPAEKTRAALEELGLSETDVVKITTLIGTHGSVEDVAKLDFVDVNSEGFKELEAVMAELAAVGVKDVEVDMMIVRGLDYYTGTVFETVVPGYEFLGSICSGGRYDNLCSNYTDQKFPGVGGSIGLTRLFCIFSENGLLEDGTAAAPIDVAVIPMDQSMLEAAYKLAASIRAEGKSVDVITTDKKLGDKMKHAARVAQFGIVVGEDEVVSGRFEIKNFATGETAPLAM
ncbi:histidine--tRNA ligase [Candidatus Saccharibacteria bacterium]|nr:histidine--tRNA ligase [Candidatus Saccharibacteria bacterium]